VHVGQEKLRTLHPMPKQIESGDLKVDDVHTIHYRVYGNVNAEKTALFLHGGPGAGCFPNHARFFDPERWRVVLFDQRGCGSSTPKGCEVNNDTPHLISDIEQLRQKIDGGQCGPVPAWDVVLGGSWGVTLALAYAQKHPDRVRGIILRGVCTMRAKEICWLFGPEGGASSLNPRGYKDFVSELTEDERRKCHTVLEAFRSRLFSPDANVRSKAASRWSSWEGSMSSLSYSFSPPSVQTITAPGAVTNAGEGVANMTALASEGLGYDVLTNSSVGSVNRTQATPDSRAAVVQWDGRRWLVDGRDEKMLQEEAQDRFRKRFASRAAANASAANASATNSSAGGGAGNASSAASPMSGWVPAQAMLTCFYSLHGGFLTEGQLMEKENVDRIRHIPCVAVQGAADMICPPGTALDLHEAWPEMRLVLVGGAGHSMYDPKITHELVKATDQFFSSDGSPTF